MARATTRGQPGSATSLAHPSHSRHFGRGGPLSKLADRSRLSVTPLPRLKKPVNTIATLLAALAHTTSQGKHVRRTGFELTPKNTTATWCSTLYLHAMQPAMLLAALQAPRLLSTLSTTTALYTTGPLIAEPAPFAYLTTCLCNCLFFWYGHRYLGRKHLLHACTRNTSCTASDGYM